MSSQIIIPLIAALVAALWFAAAFAARKTTSGLPRLPLVGGVLAVLLGIAVTAVIVLEVPISAAVAIPMFVAVILEFGLTIAYVSRLASGRVSSRLFLVCVLVIIAAILTGIVLMFQPWTPKLFNLGFDIVLIALLTFMIWSHIAPKHAATR